MKMKSSNKCFAKLTMQPNALRQAAGHAQTHTHSHTRIYARTISLMLAYAHNTCACAHTHGDKHAHTRIFVSKPHGNNLLLVVVTLH